MRRLPQGKSVKSADVSIGRTVFGSDSAGKNMQERQAILKKVLSLSENIIPGNFGFAKS